ncbi:MAG: hypothetical protein HZB23_10425 [Deltaproteobacteria bacterium]|nr:hypothetical protein [Deltaproteobacteria bacterium]
MKGRAFFAIIVLTGLFLAAGTLLAGEPVKITGRVLGHVLAGDDDRLYEMVPSPKSEALMDLAGRRVTISGILLNDCDWTCIIEITDFSDLSDQTPPPQAVFVPARPKKEEPARIEPEKTPEPAPAPVVAEPAPPAQVIESPAPPAPTVAEPPLPAGDPSTFRAR